MSKFPEPSDPDDWQPATSRPGELYTFDGSLRAYRAFFRGLRNHDRRLRSYRRSMFRPAIVFLGLAVAIGLIVGIAAALF